VSTEPSEAVVVFDLAVPLYGGSFSAIQELTSDLSGERLNPLDYDSDALTLTVGGFVPDTSRVVTLTYHADTQWSIRVADPHFTATGFDEAPTEAQDWVIITDASPVLAPYETRDVLIVLEIPEGADVPSQHWEFWICATAGGGQVQAEMASRWLVSMRS